MRLVFDVQSILGLLANRLNKAVVVLWTRLRKPKEEKRRNGRRMNVWMRKAKALKAGTMRRKVPFRTAVLLPLF